MAIIIAPARSSADLDEAAALFRNYVAWLGIDLSFQDFDADIADLSAKYAPLEHDAKKSARVFGCHHAPSY